MVDVNQGLVHRGALLATNSGAASIVEIWLPYGSSDIPVRVPEERLLEIFETKQASKPLDAIGKAKELLESNNSFRNATASAKHICITLGASGNASLSRDLIELLMQDLSQYSQARVTLLRTRRAPELETTPPAETTIAHHDSDTSSVQPLENAGTSYKPELNREFLSADVRIVLGELRPDPFLESSGLSDVIFPGLASTKSIADHMSSRPSLTALDLRKERLTIAEAVPNVFALGFVLDTGRQAIEISFDKTADTVRSLRETLELRCLKIVTKAADILVMSAGGMPQDETLLDAVETFPAGLAGLKKNKALVVAAECENGHGNAEFYEWSAERKELRHLEARLRHNFNFNGFKAAFLQRALQSHRIYLVSTIPDHYVANMFGMKPAATLNAALQSAQRALGADSTVAVVPDASRIIIKQSPEVTASNGLGHVAPES